MCFRVVFQQEICIVIQWNHRPCEKWHKLAKMIFEHWIMKIQCFGNLSSKFGADSHYSYMAAAANPSLMVEIIHPNVSVI